jgi:hypothetical protein
MRQAVAATIAVASDEKSVTLYRRRLNHAQILLQFDQFLASISEKGMVRTRRILGRRPATGIDRDVASFE